MFTIQSEWIEYREKTIPKDAPKTQIQEMRRSFYSGAYALLKMQWSMSDGSISDDAGAALIESWHQECRDFAALVGTPAEQSLP